LENPDTTDKSRAALVEVKCGAMPQSSEDQVENLEPFAKSSFPMYHRRKVRPRKAK
jgi:hypothetical protein